MRGRLLAIVVLTVISAAILLGMPRTGAALLSDRPAWHDLPLTNARTGETFRLVNFAGKTVYVEPMATWCINCRMQLGMVREARAQVDPDRVVFVALSVETSLSNAQLARFADANGFDWHFAVASPELLQALTTTYGHTVVNPPTTPHFTIGPDGATSELSTGFHSAESLVQSLSAIGGG
ncbi:MAG: TlpA family protein disulfide reductase [Chloroflexi bacterium]|nr:TlpA family protein disulfide reductase [Chloroflexota bacterium]